MAVFGISRSGSTDELHAHLHRSLADELNDGNRSRLDGFLAKRYGWQSVLGGILDPIADKLLLSVCFLGLWSSQHSVELLGGPGSTQGCAP